jgi:CDP-glucose 4,6-dehydratase
MVERQGAMENLVIGREFWQGRRVLVTGNTGFKGGWLSLWLHRLGAKVSGYGLAPNTDPSLFRLLEMDKIVSTTIADINDRVALDAHLRAHDPEIVFHLAAQPLVRLSYATPVETFATNVIGTVNLLDAVRHCPAVRAVVVITSDKCYENQEWVWGYRETEAMGGHDPYSASKGCTELATSAMRRSYFTSGVAAAHPARVASARAGNVIGGGDWSDDRLVPDIVRGCLGATGVVTIRNPKAVRPWQHVLEPLGGYLRLAQVLHEEPAGYDEGWNFGPVPGEERRVLEVAEAMVTALNSGRIAVGNEVGAVHEANLLRLDIAKARQRLGWKPALNFEQTVAMTAAWYAAWRQGDDLIAFTDHQIEEYEAVTNRP